MSFTWTAFRLRLALLAISAIILGWMVFMARGVLIPLIVGLVFVFAVNPVVRWLEVHLPPRGRWLRMRRLAAILLVYAGFLVLLATLVAALLPLLLGQGARFIQDFPQLVESAKAQLRDRLGGILAYFAPDLQVKASAWVDQALEVLLRMGQQALAGMGRQFATNLQAIVAFISIPIWAFYLLLDRDTLGTGFVRLFPEGARKDIENLISICARVVGSYFRGQLFLGLVVGLGNFIGFTLVGMPYAPLLGFIAGMAELLPIIGPWLGAIPAVVVALAFDPSKLPWVILIATIVQVAENYLLVPKIQGWTLRLHPAVIIVLLILGNEIAGFWGAVLINPLAALARDVFVYLYQRWSGMQQLADQKDTLVAYPLPESRERHREARAVVDHRKAHKRARRRPRKAA